jgi:hypothetical protein
MNLQFTEMTGGHQTRRPKDHAPDCARNDPNKDRTDV